MKLCNFKFIFMNLQDVKIDYMKYSKIVNKIMSLI